MRPVFYRLIVVLALGTVATEGFASSFSSVTETVVEPQALTLTNTVTFGQWINCRAFQQDLLITHANRQYAAYYNAARHVCVARRSLPDGNWEILELDDYTMTTDDSHNVVSIGIAPGDGTIHLAFDHHVSALHYRRSIPGALDSASWNASLFGPVTNELALGNAVGGITYPRFDTSPDGSLILSYRTGYPTNGQRALHRYATTTGLWSTRTRFISEAGTFTDVYGTSASRSGYLNPLRYDTNGRLHATWVWRDLETPETGSLDNHDLMYLFSDDKGLTWRTGDGALVDGAGRVDTPGITAVEIPRGLGLINSNAQAVDDQGRVHVIMRHCTDASLAEAGYTRGEVAFGPTAARRLHHYWRDFDNTWHHTELPVKPGSRSAALVADHEGNLIFAHQTVGKLEILEATILNSWQDWTVIYTRVIGSNVDILADTPRWREDGVLSIPYQKVPVAWGDPSTLSVIDFVKAETAPTIPALYAYQTTVLEDAFVRNNGTQDGGGQTLFVKNVTNDEFDRKTYLKFDTARARAPYFSARLRLHVNTVTGPVTVAVYEVDDDTWTEDTITWATAPSFGGQIAVRTIRPGDTFVEWDVTQSLATSPDTIQSFALWANATASEDLTFRAREFGDGSDAPVLLIQSGSPYSEWAQGHLDDADLLVPLADANHDGIPNLLAFSMGLHSPLEFPSFQPVEISPGDGTALTASIRRAAAAELYSPVLEQSTTMGAGSWSESVYQEVDTGFHGPGIDRVRVVIDQSPQFFRYRADP